MTALKLIVGLGNPGSDYDQTRHNAGADWVTELGHKFNVSLQTESKFFGLSGRIRVAGCDLRLLIPTTFMNRSGQAVGAMANFYKIEPEQILVVHDELDLSAGVARLKTAGGHGGHNGLRDIIQALGNNKGFHRLRLGIGHPGSSKQVVNYVLKRAPASERDATNAAGDAALAQIDQIANGDWPNAMNQLHCFDAS